ncbi:hypothetical protein OF83DRAFT_1169328 [Amylostereum chailletii]|nr:hypothetical protein OF83DRAFT_1169328 [Amylostereum chailletii]
MPPMPAPSASMQAVQTHPVAGPSRLAASEKDEMADYEVLEKYKPVIRYVQEFLGKLKARRDEELRLAGSDEDLQEEAMANYQASLEKAYERILDWREKVVGTREWTPRAHALKWLEGNMAG